LPNSPTNLTEPSLAEWLHNAVAQLHRSESARLDAELLLADALETDRSALYAWPERLVPVERLSRLNAWLARRVAGEPIAYIRGVQEFWSLPLRVTPDVLVPRADTECLVSNALARLANQKWQQYRSAMSAHDSPHVIDLGTGSGAVAVAIANDCKVPVLASDISHEALAVAAYNAAHFAPGLVSFVQCHWLAAIALKQPALILSNPPYIAQNDVHLRALNHEPTQALVADNEGLADLFHIIDGVANNAPRGSEVLLEHGHQQASAVRQKLRDTAFMDIQSYTDIAGIERVTGGVCR